MVELILKNELRKSEGRDFTKIGEKKINKDKLFVIFQIVIIITKYNLYKYF